MPITAQDPTLLCSVSVQNHAEPDAELSSATYEHLLVKDLFPEPSVSSSPMKLRREHLPEIVGNFELIKMLGQGSTGVVWQAVHLGSVQREVALKIMHADRHDHHALLRFAAEVRALASLDHPNIAKVWEYGSTPFDQPYLAMELIVGAPLVKYADTWSLPLHDRIRLMIAVCRGVQHAHQRGILHRDLKPANILVMRQEGVAIPKVIDFGLAKSLNGPLVPAQIETTQRGCLLGTIGYMSPEQAELDQHDVDTRSDVHALSAVLYELLTGTLPIPKEELHRRTLGDALDLIRKREPELPSRRVARLDEELCQSARCQLPPGQLSLKLKGDLDAILLKGLAKDRAARYQSAHELANDLERYLAGGIVQARQRTKRYIAHKLLRRHWRLASLIFAFGLVIFLGLIGTTWGLYWALHERTQARNAAANMAHAREREREAKQDAEHYGKFLADVLTFVRPLGDRGRGKETTLLEALDAAASGLDARFQHQPRAEGLARLALARSYLSLGRTVDAQNQIHAALGHVSAFEEDAEEFFRQGKLLLIEAYTQLKELDRAEIECRALLERYTLQESDLAATQAARPVFRLLTNILLRQNKFAEAEALLLKMIAQDQPASPSSGDLSLDLRCELIVLYVSWGAQDASKWLRADQLIETLLRQHVGNPFPEMQLLNLRASLLRIQGKTKQAAVLYREILDQLNDGYTFRDKHLFALAIQKNLAATLQALGRDAEAEQLLEQAYQAQKAALGLTHAMTQNTLQSLLQVQEERGDVAGPFLRFFEELLQGQIEAKGWNHAVTLETGLRYLNWLADLNRWEEVGKQGKALQSALLAVEPADEAALAQVKALLGLAAKEDPAASQDLFNQATALARRTNRGDVIALVQNHFGWYLHRGRRAQEAEYLLTNSLRNLPQDRRSLERGMQRLIKFYQDEQKSAQREQWLWNLAETNWKSKTVD
jgi:serine/threonine protein kinase